MHLVLVRKWCGEAPSTSLVRLTPSFRDGFAKAGQRVIIANQPYGEPRNNAAGSY
jgi:hypothetical protein